MVNPGVVFISLAHLEDHMHKIPCQHGDTAHYKSQDVSVNNYLGKRTYQMQHKWEPSPLGYWSIKYRP